MKRFSLPSLAKIFKLTAPWAIVAGAGLFLSLADLTDAATPPGTWIQNQASATYTNSGVAVTSTSNAVSNMVAQAVSIVFDSETDSPIPGATVTLFNAETGAPARVYEADGVTTAPNTVVTGPDGGYNFDYVTAGTYRLQITPPPTHSAPSRVAASTLPSYRYIDSSGSYGRNFLVPKAGALVVVDVPADPVTSEDGLFVQKLASRRSAEVLDLIDYTVRVQNVSGAALDPVTVMDQLPFGFLYVKNSARLNGTSIADPAGGKGPKLSFALGSLADGATATLTYRLEVGPGALRGDGVNTAEATAPGAASNRARVKVKLEGGVFTERGTIIGKVYVDRNGDRIQDADDWGIPGVRVFMEDGTYAITDSEGKYNFYGVTPRTHVVKVDATTLPRGAQLMVLANRNAFDAGSRFVDLKNHELHKADFAVGEPSEAVLEEIAARRARGDADVAATQQPLATELTPDGASAPSAVPGPQPASSEDSGPALPPRTLNSRNSSLMKEPLRTGPAVAGAADEPGYSSPVMLRRLDGQLQLLLPGEDPVADGHTPVVVEVVLTNLDGDAITSPTTVTLETAAGRWDAADLDELEPGTQVVLQGGRGEFPLVPPTEPGPVQVRVTSGELEALETVAFVPELRPLIAVGVVEGSLNLSRLSLDNLVPARDQDGFEEELTNLDFSADDGKVRGGARAAFFLKGKIKGEYLLTASYDSDKDTRGRLFRDIQPDEFYPVYGDSAVRGFDAQTSGRLYVRVDKNRSYLLYGDFNTGSTREAVGLGNYSRSLTGVKEHFETDRLSVTGWATRDSSRQVVEELPGNGTSGPYYFSTGDGLENSEKVEVLTRDRNQPSIILSTEQLSRFVDYTFEPFSGRLLFRRPVPSLDENLNPISIRVTFEVDQGGKDFWVYGAEARFEVSPVFEVGGTAVRDENPLAEYELYSANATLKVTPNTWLIGEWAQSNDDLIGYGHAGRLELRHRSAWADARLWFGQTEDDFVNPSASMTSGRQEMGATVTRQLADNTRLRLEAVRTDDQVLDVQRWDARLDLAHTFESDLRAELGLRRSVEEFTDGPDNDVTSLRGRLGLPIPQLPGALVYGEYEQDLTNADRQMVGLGGEYIFQDRGRVYARHEFISELGSPIGLEKDAQRNTTVMGVDTDYMKDGQFFNEYRLRDGIDGREGEAAFGLRNQWHLGDATRLQTSFERVNPIRGNPETESTAGTLAIEYLPQVDWKATGRVELRTGDEEDSALNTLGYARKLDDNWTMLAKSILYASDVKAGNVGSRFQSRLQLGAAWRQVSTNVWNGLFKYEFKYEDDDTQPGLSIERYVHIFSTTANWQPTEDLWTSGTYAAKLVTDDSSGMHHFNHAHLVAGRVIVDLTDRWDVGLNVSAFFDGDLDRVQYGLGPEIGFILTRNLRVAAGYNLFGYEDEDLGDSEYTNHGVFLTLRYKFDERLFSPLEEEAR